MTDDERKLLEEHGVLILPEDIAHDAYVNIVEAALIRPDKPVTLYCHGAGGDSCTAGGIVDVIRRHGNVIGLLPGDADSCHGVIFAACATRYVYPGARLGVHRVVMGSLEHVTADYALKRAEGLQKHDVRNAHIFAQACTPDLRYDARFWLDAINDNPRALHHFDAAFLIECGMARPIAEMIP